MSTSTFSPKRTICGDKLVQTQVESGNLDTPGDILAVSSNSSWKCGSSTFAPINAKEMVDIKTKEIITASVVTVELCRGIATLQGATSLGLARWEVRFVFDEST
jgi:hypothetical protein